MNTKFDYLQLEEKSLPGAFSQYDIEVLVKELEKLHQYASYLEIGVDRGKSLSVAKMVNDQLKKNLFLHGVDINKPKELKEWLDTKPGIIFFHGDSVKQSKVWKKASGPKIDLLFIDGDHSYKGCKRDIDAWYPLMEEGGVILFHDCDETSPGVVEAVNEFAKKHNFKVELFKTKIKNTSMAKIQL